MKAQDYAQALFSATTDKDDASVDTILERFVELLRARAHLALLPSVLRELEKLSARMSARHTLQVAVANAEDGARFQARIEADSVALGAESLPKRIVLDPSLVGGYEVRARGQRIDRTYKRSLVELYHTLITRS